MILTATFDGTTEDEWVRKTLSKVPPFPLVLMRDVRCSGERIHGHDWYPYWGTFEAANPQPGDLIQFQGRSRYYPKDVFWWQQGLADICWVQKKSESFNPSPVFSPPETHEESVAFLNCRLRVSEAKNAWDDVSSWGVRFKHYDLKSVIALIDAGWASFGSWYPYLLGFENIFERMEDRFDSRSISRMADIAAWCNAGSATSDHRHGASEYRLCSSKDI